MTRSGRFLGKVNVDITSELGELDITEREGVLTLLTDDHAQDLADLAHHGIWLIEQWLDKAMPLPATMASPLVHEWYDPAEHLSAADDEA